MASRSRLRPALAVLALTVLVLAASACAREGINTLPPPPKLANTTTTEPSADLSGVALARVAGQTTTTVEVGPGEASLSGAVMGPDGAVEGATVRVERLVGDARAHLDVLTGVDGRWTAPFLRGGRFRVRAWRAPDLTLVEPNVFFMEAKEARTVNLELRRFTGLRITSDIAPDPPRVGEAAHLVVLVTDETVDPEGVVRATAAVGVTVELFGSGNWRVASENPAITDAAGTAQWRLRCDEGGAQPLSVVVGDLETFAVGVPDCVVPEETTTTTTTTGPSLTSSSTSSTSTTRPSTTSTSSSTTSTTARRRD